MGGDDRFAGRRVTLHDVAEAAGVSFKTVSRVVNGEPSVAASTAARVEAVIDELGFRPDGAARSLRLRQRLQLAGLIVSDMANPHVTALAAGVEHAMRARGHAVVMANAGEDSSQERALIADLLRRGIEGLIVVPSGADHDHLAGVARRVPLVLAHRPVDALQADVVLPDDYGAAYDGVRDLLDRGHRRIAFIGDEAYIHNIQERLRAYRAAHQQAGVELDDRLVVMGSHTAESAHAAVSTLLQGRGAPSAVFASNNLNCLGALTAVAGAGADVELVGFDELLLGAYFGVPLTLLTYDQGELGRLAAGLLLDRIDGASHPARRVVVPVTARRLSAPPTAYPAR
ncbi:MAG TPA: LacI family DNA-binding transcriptional regulator [Euzebyales bacterium]|nr:LacI family DNA-binding transcriptional regulator [Euzebyales bacterium]